MAAEQPDLETRVARLEQQMRDVREDARAARHLAASADHDIADLTTEIREYRNETNTRITALENRVNTGFAAADENFRSINNRLDALDQGLIQILNAIQKRPEDGKETIPDS